MPWLIGVSLFPPGGTKSGVLDRAAFRMVGGSGDVTLMSTPMLLAPERKGAVQPEREDLSRVKLSALPLVVSPWAPTRDGLGAALCVAPRRWELEGESAPLLIWPTSRSARRCWSLYHQRCPWP